MEIDDRFVAATPEGVSLEFVLAGLGSRFVAVFLDLIIQAVAIGIVVAVVLNTIGLSTSTRLYLSIGVISLSGFLLILGYFVLFESLNAGRSPGKAMTGLRVVLVTGGPVGARASLLRNVARFADWLPSWYIVGAVLILVTSNHQRLGDMLAGTLVVRERTAVSRLSAGTAWNQPGPVGGDGSGLGRPGRASSPARPLGRHQRECRGARRRAPVSLRPGRLHRRGVAPASPPTWRHGCGRAWPGPPAPWTPRTFSKAWCW